MSHTGEAILDLSEKTLDDKSLLPVYVLHDNGANMKSAMGIYEYFSDHSCFAYTLQLAINDATSEIESMQNVLSKSKKIMSSHRHSCQLLLLLQLGGNERELIMSVAT